MKANEAPEKLYLHPTAKGEVGASWLTSQLTNEDIEYVRKDTFIEKACLWLSNVSIEDMVYKYDDFDTSEGRDEFVKDFKKYMED